jgi:hypothetical protein
MNSKLPLTLSIIFILAIFPAMAQEEEIPKLDNPMSVTFLQENLRKSSPRLVFDTPILKDLKRNINTDPVLLNMYAIIQKNAESIFEEPLLERVMEGRRLLGTSREMLYRINMLGLVYLMEKDPRVLARINDELLAVCNFSDWNPSHFLDVAEMATAVAFALDWTEGDLPKTTQELAKKSLIEKAILPSWPENGKSPSWAYGTNNWNQVCNGGMIAASIAIAEDNPSLASKTISRALDGLPHSLVEYGPDGVYPEGSTYWAYGTSFSVITAAMLESAFGTDFGHWEFPAFKESAVFRTLANAPSGWYYNFADCGDQRSEAGDFTLAWFATKSGNPHYFEKDRFLISSEKIGKLGRLAGASMAWLSQYEEQGGAEIPTAWKGEGSNPIVIFTGGENDPNTYYFGGKGGRGMVNHGNMDAGSFVFELNGIRWSIDPGNQNYNELEQTGFDLWNRSQSSERWTLLTKNNFGHSTLTVNDSLHRTEGQSELLSFSDGDEPEAIFDLSKSLEGQVKSAKRKFTKDSPTSITIEDEIELAENTQLVTWQMMTLADVEITEGGAILKQDGKTLHLQNLSHPELMVSVVSLDPAPLELDRQIEDLKRIEIRIPAWSVKGDKTKIKVRLAGE